MNGSVGSRRIRRADLADAGDAGTYRGLLDAYARDPLGQGKPLPPHVLDKVVEDLRDHPAARLFLSFIDDSAIAFATCFLGYSTFRAAPLLNIHDIAVLPEFRRRGVARQLLGFIERQAREEGCCKLTLEVRQDNPAAERLYRAKGFGPADVSGREIRYLFLEKVLH